MGYVCKMCGGIITSTDDTGVCECEHCGSRQTVPTKYFGGYTQMYNRAYKLFLNDDTNGAEKLFLQLCANVPEESEGYWGILLCRCGVKYADDPVSGLKTPFITKSYSPNVTSSDEFRSALQFATEEQSRSYRREAAAIEMLRRDLIERIGTGENYDVYLCCRNTDNFGNITKDCTYASKIYDQLIKENINVYFTPETLKELPENERDPYVNAAAENSDVFLIICSGPDSFSSAQFKMEWSKCASAAKKNLQKKLLVCTSDIYNCSVPKELANFDMKDMSQIDFLTELIRSLRKNNSQTTTYRSAVHIRNTPDKLLSRVNSFLEKEDFEAAKEYCELIIDASPQCWQAYFSHFLASNGCRNSSELMLEDVVYSFASDYSEKFGYDVSDESSFRKQLAQIIGSSVSKAVEYAENDDKLNISTIYERLCSAVREAVFVCEQEKIAADENMKLNELRKQHTKAENERRAARHIRNQLMKKRVFFFTVTIVIALAFIAIKFNFKWASVTIIIALIAAAVVISELDKH